MTSQVGFLFVRGHGYAETIVKRLIQVGDKVEPTSCGRGRLVVVKMTPLNLGRTAEREITRSSQGTASIGSHGMADNEWKSKSICGVSVDCGIKWFRLINVNYALTDPAE